MPESLRTPDEFLGSVIVSALDRNLKSANETSSIGIRLSRTLNLPQIFSIDDGFQDEMLLDEVSSNWREQIQKNPFLQKAQANSQSVYTESKKRLTEGLEKKDLLPFYLWLNARDFQIKDVDSQWSNYLRSHMESNIDRQRLALWEMRNLLIAANVRRATAFYPGKKMLVIIGAAHKPFLDYYLS